MTVSMDTSAVTGQVNGPAGSQTQYQESCSELSYLEGLEDIQRAMGQSLNAPRTLLASVIEREIIPRLFLAHRGPFDQPRRETAPMTPVAIDDREAFARLVLDGDTAQIMGHVQSLIDQGVRLERIYLDVLAPVARILGEFWEADLCTFTDVTIGLARLQQVLREISRLTGDGARRTKQRRRIYLAAPFGEQHTLGLSIVEEFFLHAGWETACDQTASGASILQTVSGQYIDVLGLSIATEDYFERLSDLVKRAHKQAQNRDMVIMVGGRFFVDYPDFAKKIGSAVVISNGINAVEMAESLLPASIQSRAP